VPATIRAFDPADAAVGLSGGINFGDSGGAVITADERLIGIVYMKDTVNAGVALALPVTLVPAEFFPQNASSTEPPLPMPVETFIGREGEIRQIVAHFDKGRRLVTVRGIGGIGKSECVRAAAQAARGNSWAANGVQYVDLKSATSASEVTALFRSAFGVAATTTAALGGLLARPALYVLDDVYPAIADDGSATRQLLRDLIDYSAPARFLVTSRAALGLGVIETIVELRQIPPPLYRELFERLARLYAYAPQPGDDARVTELLTELDGHPLSLALAANMLQDLSLAQVLARWRDKGPAALRMPGIEEADLDQLTSVDYSFALSFDDLTPAAQGLGGAFSLLPAGAGMELLQSIGGSDADTDVPLLARRSLISRTEGVYSMLVPLREFAGRTLTDEARANAVAKIDAYYIGRARAEWQSLEAWRTRRIETLAAISRELPNVHAAIDRARSRCDDASVADLTSGIAEYHVVAHSADAAVRLEMGLAAARRAASKAREAELLSSLGHDLLDD
jgi:hypothetical protein